MECTGEIYNFMAHFSDALKHVEITVMTICICIIYVNVHKTHIYLYLYTTHLERKNLGRGIFLLSQGSFCCSWRVIDPEGEAVPHKKWQIVINDFANACRYTPGQKMTEVVDVRKGHLKRIVKHCCWCAFLFHQKLNWTEPYQRTPR